MNSLDASWLIDHLTSAAVRALVPAAAAALLLALFRVRHAALRLTVWTGVLYAALAMPFLGFLLPPIPLRVPSRLLASRASSASAAVVLRSSAPGSLRSLRTTLGVAVRTPVRALTRTRAAAVPTESGLANLRSRIASLTAPEIALGIYLMIVFLLLVRVGVGLALSRRLRRTARRIEDPAATRWLHWHALAMGIDRAPLLLESDNVSVPLTLGAWRPVVLLPGDWREWESGKLSAVIAHELSHVSRNDSRTRALSVACRTFFWFSPLSWWLEGHLAALAEQASDLAAIGAGAEPGYYAEVLMSFFRAIQSNGARVCRQGVAMARIGQRFGVRGGRVQNRIETILSSGGTLSGKPKARLLLLMALLAVPLLYLAAATRPVLVASPSTLAATGQWPAPAPPAPPAVAPVAPEAPPAPPPRFSPVATPMLAPPAPPPHISPVATPMPAPPAPPPAWSQGPEPPEPPEPPQGGDDNWTINNVHEGMTFAVVHGNSVMMNGSGDDRDEVRDLQKKIGGDFIWFIHAGNSYVIRDSAMVERALQLYAPMDELGRQQDELGRQQDALGRKQDELGHQQDEVRIKVPADLEARLKRVEDEIRQLGPTASQDDLGRLQGELGDLQGYLGDLQGRAGDQQGELGKKQGELGAEQGELGRKQGELGRKQGEIAREAAVKMQAIIEKALAAGKAQRAPQ